jgi:hypothetical protein
MSMLRQKTTHAEQKTMLGGCQRELGGCQSWMEEQVGRRQSWADLKAGQMTMLVRCQRKLGGCQSWAKVKGDQKLKLIKTSL